MLGFIKGTIQTSLKEEIIVLTSGGIGYRLFWTKDAAKPGAPFECFISHVIREREQTLYGFRTVEELQVFETLLTVSGVGPKSAFSIVTVMAPKKIQDAVQRGEGAVFTTIPGIGKRVASKIVIELKDKLDQPLTGNPDEAALVETLKGLGYRPDEIRAALAELPEAAGLQAKVSAALKWLGRRR